jgi:hypothetical protein
MALYPGGSDRDVYVSLTRPDQLEQVRLVCVDLRMTTTQIVMSAFAVLIGGLMLPLPSGIRSGLFLALVALAVLTFLGGGMHYITSLF